jgi:hypothetical protein
MDNKCEQIVIATNETELPTTSSGWWVVQMGFKKKCHEPDMVRLHGQ